LAGIVGVPWQDIASKESLTSPVVLQYLTSRELTEQGRWPLLLGKPSDNPPASPSDPFMIESSAARQGTNPVAHFAIAPADSMNPHANPINGHEQNIPGLDDLQYACTFPLSSPKVCMAGDPECDCSPDKQGNFTAVTICNSPLCQPPTGGAATTTQYYGKAQPGTRELEFGKQLGARVVPASICPRTLTDASSPDYAYKPAFNALLRRIGSTLE